MTTAAGVRDGRKSFWLFYVWGRGGNITNGCRLKEIGGIFRYVKFILK
jgi:hypothetical protein